MTFSEIYQKSAEILRNHPFIWLIALLVGFCDLWIVWSFQPETTVLSFRVLFLGIPIALLEAAIIFAICQVYLDRPINFVDSTMYTLVYSLTILITRGVAYVAVGIFFLVIYFLLGPVMPAIIQANDYRMWVLAAIIGFFLILFQLFSALVMTSLMLSDESIGGALSDAIDTIRDLKTKWVVLILPMLLLDLVLLWGIVQFNGVTYGSLFEYEISAEMAQQKLDSGIPAQPAGTYFSMTRSFNSVLTGAWKIRGVDLTTVLSLVLPNRTIAALFVFLQAILIPLRVTPIVVTHIKHFENTA